MDVRELEAEMREIPFIGRSKDLPVPMKVPHVSRWVATLAALSDPFLPPQHSYGLPERPAGRFRDSSYSS